MTGLVEAVKESVLSISIREEEGREKGVGEGH